MKYIAPLLVIFSLTGCAPLVIGAGVGVGLTAHRDWCWRHYGNDECRRMPMGVHR